MPLLINNQEPYLRILNPETGEYVAFHGGKLEIDEDDPNYEAVMAEAQRRPSIAIHIGVTTCPECGEPFSGKAAKAQLGQHRKQVHFNEWLADRNAEHAQAIDTEVKARAGYACDACQPIQTFGSLEGPGGLAEHIKLLHTAPPALDDEGNEVGGGHRPGEVDTRIPAATPSGG